MKYEEYEKAISRPRLNIYLNACKGNKRKAIRLYRLNIKLSQSFYAILSILEVIIRNSIDEHYKKNYQIMSG